jgi:predicted nucleic acid-binding protein
MPAVIDTNVLYARAYRDDDFHDDATAIVDTIDSGETETVHVTTFVIAETMNLVTQRAGHEVAVNLLDRIQASVGFEIVRPTAAVYNSAEAIFRNHELLSFVDASIVAYIRHNEITTLYSFDTDFETVTDVTRRTTV